MLFATAIYILIVPALVDYGSVTQWVDLNTNTVLLFLCSSPLNTMPLQLKYVQLFLYILLIKSQYLIECALINELAAQSGLWDN